jgi:hypothetical protein
MSLKKTRSLLEELEYVRALTEDSPPQEQETETETDPEPEEVAEVAPAVAAIGRAAVSGVGRLAGHAAKRLAAGALSSMLNGKKKKNGDARASGVPGAAMEGRRTRHGQPEGWSIPIMEDYRRLTGLPNIEEEEQYDEAVEAVALCALAAQVANTQLGVVLDLDEDEAEDLRQVLLGTLTDDRTLELHLREAQSLGAGQAIKGVLKDARLREAAMRIASLLTRGDSEEEPVAGEPVPEMTNEELQESKQVLSEDVDGDLRAYLGLEEGEEIEDETLMALAGQEHVFENAPPNRVLQAHMALRLRGYEEIAEDEDPESEGEEIEEDELPETVTLLTVAQLMSEGIDLGDLFMVLEHDGYDIQPLIDAMSDEEYLLGYLEEHEIPIEWFLETIFEWAYSQGDQLDERYIGFRKLEKRIADRGGVRDPGAVAAAIGRKKYGKKKFQKYAAADKKMRGAKSKK